MKATMSIDLKRRVNIRLNFRFDIEQVANLLALHAVTYGDVGEELSEKKLMETVKQQLTYKGTDQLEFDTQDVTDEAYEWAKEQVSKYWKEV